MSDVLWVVALVVGSLAAVCLGALLVFASLAGKAINRARREDVPGIMDLVGRTVLGLFASLRQGVARVPGGVGQPSGSESAQPQVDAGAGGEV
ncbi:hypothetical protein OG311_00055 [Streptomyces sp. NBC_01343]|uniref:hypothetical protein n=1 Tax=Streptomyces sp. NBC_01343 TaxID=2903832 RepID=UPI002E11FB56|nr:hypothetical protein OG311_00055 [Streptomyces sp. NBC_01343]